MKKIDVSELIKGGPEPLLLSEWLDLLRSLKRKHGDVVLEVEEGDLGELPNVSFYLNVPDKRKCGHCGLALPSRKTNSCRCGAWTDPKRHYRMEKE